MSAAYTNDASDHRTSVRTTTETKPSLKTTELIAYVVVTLGVLIASAVTDNGNDGQGFAADQAWFFVTLLTVGYMISRGLAKAGSYEKEHHTTDDNAGR